MLGSQHAFVTFAKGNRAVILAILFLIIIHDVFIVRTIIVLWLIISVEKIRKKVLLRVIRAALITVLRRWARDYFARLLCELDDSVLGFD